MKNAAELLYASRYPLLFCLGLMLVPPSWADLLEYRRDAILTGEWWRMWGGHFVHYSGLHAGVNAALFLLLSAFLGRLLTRRLALWLGLFAPLVISLTMLILVPEMAVYRGASSLTSLLLALAIGHALIRASGPEAWALIALIVAWLEILLMEILGAGFTTLPSGIQVAWQAHVAGILLGLAGLFRREVMGQHELHLNA